jgi:hypothetical protein
MCNYIASTDDSILVGFDWKSVSFYYNHVFPHMHWR